MPAIWLRGISNIFPMTGEIYATEKLAELILNNHTDISIQFGSCRAFSDLKFAYCGPNQLMTFLHDLVSFYTEGNPSEL